MKVIAIELGYDNVTLRNPGEEFDMPDDVFNVGEKFWFEPADPAEKEKVAAKFKSARKPDVAAVDPAKQAADRDASVREQAEKQSKSK